MSRMLTGRGFRKSGSLLAALAADMPWAVVPCGLVTATPVHPSWTHIVVQCMQFVAFAMCPGAAYGRLLAGSVRTCCFCGTGPGFDNHVTASVHLSVFSCFRVRSHLLSRQEVCGLRLPCFPTAGIPATFTPAWVAAHAACLGTLRASANRLHVYISQSPLQL